MPLNAPEIILRAVNSAAVTPPSGAEAEIGWLATGLGPALLVAIAGLGPIVVAVNLDLVDDEVAIGGPDAAGVRRLFRGRNNGDGTNTIEAVVQPATTGNVGQVAITAADTAIVAASATRRAIIVWNIGMRDVDIFLAGAAGAFGAGARIPTPVAGAPVPFRFAYNGAVRAIRGGGGANGRLSFAEELD